MAKPSRMDWELSGIARLTFLPDLTGGAGFVLSTKEADGWVDARTLSVEVMDAIAEAVRQVRHLGALPNG